MLRIITLTEIKSQARVVRNDEDTLITMYGESAEEAILQLLNRTLESIIDEYGYVPANIKHACLMLAAHWYDTRIPVSQTNLTAVPYTFDILIKPYAIL